MNSNKEDPKKVKSVLRVTASEELKEQVEKEIKESNKSLEEARASFRKELDNDE